MRLRVTTNLRSDEYRQQFLMAEQAYEADDMPTAIRIFTELGELGVAPACQYLGLIYKTGDGIPPDIATANFWYEKYLFLLAREAASGDVEAILALGKHYQYGDLVAIDFEKAYLHIALAAEKGLPDAQFHLACLYRYGWCGRHQDFREFEHWLDIAINSEHPEAIYTKALLLLEANDSESRVRAREFLAKAASLEFWPAQQQLNKFKGV